MRGNRLIPLLRRGDGSTLSLDFTAMSSASDLSGRGITFTRASTTNSGSTTFINSSGYVTTATTNEPRFDYDPTTLTPRGLLIEGSATNLTTYSADFSNANWLLDNGSATSPAVSSVSQSAPNGAASVNRITFNKTGGTFSRIRQTLSGTAAATYTLSVWMKANTASGGAATQNVGLRIGADSAGFNCVVTTTWKRFQYSYALSGTDASVQIMLWDNIVGNDETADVLVWGAQLETGSGASSYIGTGANTATRAADDCYVTGSNFTPWYNATTGTLLVSARPGSAFYDSSGYDFAAVLTRNATTTDHVGVAQWSSGLFAVSRSSGTYSLNYASLGVAGGAAYKAAITYAAADFAAVANNGTVQTSASGSVPSAVDRLRIGGSRSGSAVAGFSGTISLIKYWPTRLPNATLQSLTA